ncbi:MAG: o-succinylbenzoate--CoA ligase, partial [Halobaculum sp.]
MRDWLAHRSTSTPDAEALVAAASGTTWSYEELDEAAAAMAGSLAALGLESGDHLGVFLTPRIEYVTLVHAAMRLGVRLVPVSDRLTETELQPRLERADVTAVLCAEATEQRTVEAVAEDDEDGPSVPVVSLDEPQWERVTYLKSVDPVEVDAHDWDPTEPLVYLFTSGSTGEPKLVELRVRNVRHSATTLLFRLGVDPGDRYLLTLPLHHTGGLMPLYRAVLAGTSVVLRTAFDPGGAADDIRTYDVTGVSLVPTMLKRMLDARGTLADSLRVVLLGGAPAPDKLIERCRDYSVPVHPTYGMTEAASAITVASPTEAFENLGTVGRQLLWTELTVRGEDGERLQPGEVGELVVDGPSVTPGYYDAPEATEAAFGPHGFRTGDVGYRTEDGYVYVLNRKDDRIVTGGENVDPGEVVATLRDHPHVEDAAVVGVPDEEWGERVASLVVRDDDSMTPADLEAFCRERLADFKIPKTIRFTDALPRTDSGSVRRPDVRERIAAAEEAAIGDADTAVEAVPEEPPTEETAAEDDSEVEPP